MRLGERIATLRALGDRDVRALCIDSRKAAPGALFFALPGTKVDGAAFAAAAVAQGAIGVVSAAAPTLASVPWVQVPDARVSLAEAARVFFGRDESPMKYAGVTGTNGKTTLTYLLEAIAQAAGKRALVIGTVEHRLGDKRWPSSHTTPDAIALCERIVEAEKLGADWTVMEVSSHGLDQHRADALAFDVAGFTNLTPDHLDYHGSMDAYFAAKLRLFSALVRQDGAAAVNLDGAMGPELLAKCTALGRSRVLGCSATRADADVYVSQVTHGLRATELLLRTPAGELALRSPLIGSFNVENVALAVTMALGAGFDLAAIRRGIEGLAGVPGRLERVLADDGRVGFVDYAHTPDALERVLATLRALPHEGVLCVFGCGGDRDRTKRPLMGAAVAKLADIAIVTSDNPRTEDPQAIIRDILPGFPAGRGYEVIADRRQAIRAAAARTGRNDILLVAGKGHEDYQIIGTEKHHFDDREELRAAFALGVSA
ncbi:MAG: UDP-N-acetylmuramoyl-L-alanyl-D-glutamate--2,6-diaminopimelate ligase [Deltaproteobacteria bacterium]|nr:UDP-N-acetylmuramoyl-L-alanyl-D-glutamate--2,6-diaminopimelate ligase [Deltaproteobacteria bacterium]